MSWGRWSRWSWGVCLLAAVLEAPAAAQGAAPFVQDMHSQDRGLGQLVAGQWRCLLQDIVSGRRLSRVLEAAAGAAGAEAASEACYPDVTVHAYSGWPPRRRLLDPRRPGWLPWLRWSGWDPRRRSVLLVHGFNGGMDKAPLTALRDAYLELGDANVLTLDWSPLARYPCYADAVRHSRTAARCGARVVAALQAAALSASAAPASTPDPRFACVGHSLGAHICAMISRTLPRRLSKVVALDPARPQVSRLLGDDALSAGAARLVQSFHSNMGFYGEYPALSGPGARASGPLGHASFCLNGGRLQPNCDRGGRFARARCSHFLGVCMYAQLVRGSARPGLPDDGTWVTAVPCDGSCDRVRGQPPFAVKLTEATMDRWRGTHCLDLRLDSACRIDV